MQTFNVDQLVGSTLGEYQIEHLLGHGQLGAAYTAQQPSQGRTVMITLFNFPQGMSAQEGYQYATRFAQERAMLVRLTHPNILPVYDLGEHAGSLYLVTAFVKGASLAQVLKQRGRFTPRQTLDVLKQVAASLDYTQSQGAVHGLLSLSQVLISDKLTLQLAGFGLRTLLEVSGKRLHTQPQAYLFSTSGTLLGNPAFVSPERVLGQPVDAGSDLYALGVMLFELLSGTLPFRGATPLDMALERIQQPVPSVHAVCPDVPEALDLVLSQMLERDPAKRYQRAGESAAAFERVLTLLEATQRATDSRTQQVAQRPQLTLAPTVNWYEEAGMPAEQWQSGPPVVTTGHLPVVTTAASFQTTARDGVGSGPMQLPGAATHPDGSTALVRAQEVLPAPAGNRPASLAGGDPFAWWEASSPGLGAPPRTPGTFTRRAPVRLVRSNPHARRRPAQQDRRRLVMLLAGGTAGVLTVSGISFAYFTQSMKRASSQIATAPTTAGSTAPATTQGNTPAVGTTQGAQKTPVPSKSPTAQPSPSATKAPQSSPTAQPTQQPTPTQPPAPTPTPPSHTGTVIGHATQATNSAVSFTNPADGQASWLVHLSNGSFVAVEQACTHAGVPVKYNASTGQFNCPAHGATFNADGTNPTSPAPSPLPRVTIRVNADGTITTG